MRNYRFVLEKYKGQNSRHTCPQCGQKNCFTFFVDRTTGKPAGDEYGRCDHENNCGYHLYPDGRKIKKGDLKMLPVKKKPISLTNINDTSPYKNPSGTNLYNWLLQIFEGNEKTVKEVTALYLVGSVPYWNEKCTMFWYVDFSGKVRGGKIMGYDKNGRRMWKEGKNGKVPVINWHHKAILKATEYNLVQCFFGEHLLAREKEVPICVAESEKTALVGAIVAKLTNVDLTWLACGSLNGLTAQKCVALRGKEVFLAPDYGKVGREKWITGKVTDSGWKRPAAYHVKAWAKKVSAVNYPAIFPDIQLYEGDDYVDMLLRENGITD